MGAVERRVRGVPVYSRVTWKGNPSWAFRRVRVALFTTTMTTPELKARKRAEYAYFLSYRTRWSDFEFCLMERAF